MQTLWTGQWLNDEIINFYMSLLMERSKSPGFPALHIFSTVFLHETEGWETQGCETVDTNCEHLCKGHCPRAGTSGRPLDPGGRRLTKEDHCLLGLDGREETRHPGDDFPIPAG